MGSKFRYRADPWEARVVDGDLVEITQSYDSGQADVIAIQVRQIPDLVECLQDLYEQATVDEGVAATRTGG